MTAVFGMIAGLLQLSVPSYGFRLVRRYGIQRVGWFLVTAFALLALLHLLLPATAGVNESDILMHILYGGAAVLMLIGMGHMETLFVHRAKVEQTTREQWESQVKAEAAQLGKSNRELLQQLAFRDHNEAALKRAEAEQRMLFNECPQAMWVVDMRTSGFLAMNKAALRMYGYDQRAFGALTMRDLLADATDPGFAEQWEAPCTEASSRGRWVHRRRDGTLIEVEIAAVDVQYAGCDARLVAASDATVRAASEKELARSVRDALLRRFTDGVVRRFHQLFDAVERNVSRLRSESAADSETLSELSVAARRGAGLTGQLLMLNGEAVFKPELMDLNQFIRAVTPKLAGIAGDHIQIQASYGCHQGFIHADRRLVEHALVNLIINARDAMPGGGAILLHTAIFHGGDRRPRGEYVCLTVRDNGPGIPDEVRARMFEPFVTTKDSAGALGLGLATAQAIAKQHSGWAECLSQPGAGTEINLYFPFANPPEEAETELIRAQPGRKATVLLVEADDRLRSLARCTLNWNGFRVIEADSPALATVLWGQERKQIDVLLTAMTFPSGAMGIELVALLQQDRPDLKVLYTTDGTGLDAVPDAPFLLKPFAPEHLLREMTALVPAR